LNIVPGYATGELAKISGVSVRTLQYYDRIGLLKPASYSGAGYRRYDETDALRLQQILFYRELGLEPAEIRRILTKPDFDPLPALESHRVLLKKKAKRLQALLRTVDKTINKLKGEQDMDVREYYQGFSDAEVESMRREAREKYGEQVVADSEARVMNLGKEKMAAVQAEFDSIYRGIAAAMGKGSDSSEVQAGISRWRELMENFSHYTDDMVLGLGRMYSADDRFAAFYRKYHPDMPGFMTAAIEYHVANRDK
jgi:DNA-binding transcriptional MerR regulator